MRNSRPLLVLIAAGTCAALALWLLRTPGREATGPAGTVSSGETRPADAPAGVFPVEPPTDAPLPTNRGAVTGALSIPALPGGAAVRAMLTVLREGQAVATAEAAAGLFRVEYPRAAGDPGPFSLRAEAPRRAPVEVALPLRVVDAGEIRLLSGLTYGGRLLDANRLPVEGVVVDFSAFQAVAASSAPSAADGSFLIPLPPGVNLQGLHGEARTGWGAGPPVLEPKARGRLFLPVETKPEGLAGQHEVVLEERPVGIRLRFLDEASGLPIVGAAASLWSGQDFGFNMPALSPFDAATTDALGIYAPLWPLLPKVALVRVIAGGSTLWTLLDRSDAESKEPRDLVLPKDPLVLTVRCVEDATGKAMAGVQLVLGTNAGLPFAGTTDASGEIRWALFPSDSFDPEPLEVAGWSAAWREGAGNPRREMDMNFRGPQAAEDAEGPSPVFGAPVVLRLGKKADTGLWVRVDAPPGGEPFLPEVLRACVTPDKGFFLFSGQPAGPVADAAGRPLWWFWEFMMDGTAEAYMPKEGTFPVELVGPGRDPLLLRGDRAMIRAAHRSETPLVFAAPAVEAMTRSLLVVGPGGKPAAGVIVAVLPGGERTMLSYQQQERERGVTGADGRVPLQCLDPGGKHLVAAWDPATGNSGVLAGLDVAAPPEKWRIALEAPREIRVRVRFAGGVAMTTATLSLAPLSAAFPAVPGATSKDGEFAIPACPVPILNAWVAGFGPRNDYRYVQMPARDVEGKDVVLEKR